jgi:ABC-type multidrug transport system ATPase subunit
MSAAPSAVLNAVNLCFGYPQRTLFTDWDCALPAGITLLQGDESTGKTTLLRLLAGEQHAQSGRLQCGGIWLDEEPKLYREQVFRTDPRAQDSESITPLQFLARLAPRYPRLDMSLGKELVDGLSLTGHMDKPLYMLSTGSRRKVWLLAAFTAGATVTLLDEPFAALDAKSIAFVHELLQDAVGHNTRSWIVADYTAPQGVPLAHTIVLADLP